MFHQLMVICIGAGMLVAGIRLLATVERRWLGVHSVFFGIACCAIGLGAQIQPWTLMLTPLALSWIPTGRPRDRLSLVGGLAACGSAAIAVFSVGEGRIVAIGVAAALTATTCSREVRRTTGDLRWRVDFFTVGVVLDLALLSCLGVVHLLSGWPADLRGPAVAAQVLLPIFFVGSTSNTILRHSTRIMETALPWTVITVASVSTYAIAVAVATGGAPPDSGAFVAGLLVVAAVPWLVARLHAVLRRRTNRFLYGNDRAPRDVIQLLRRKIDDGMPDQQIFAWVTTAIRDSLPADDVSIWRSDEIEMQPMAHAGSSMGGPVPIPRTSSGGMGMPPQLAAADLSHRGEKFGVLTASRSPTAPPFTGSDNAALQDLAVEIARILERSRRESQLEITLRALRDRAEELRRSRRRVVAAADDARRQLERDLHDGAQQYVLAAAVGVQNARTLMRSDHVAQAMDVLDQLETGMHETLASLRALAQGAYPPALESGGLPEALVSIASNAALPVALDIGPINRLDHEKEAAVYFVCVEAIQNATKHGGAGTRVRIQVGIDNDLLSFCVRDTGSGFDTSGAGHRRGLTHMTDRIGALGGELLIESVIGTGTTITGAVDLDSDKAALMRPRLRHRSQRSPVR